MKKSKIYLLAILLSTVGTVYAQIGINNQSPQAIFHIDGAKDNNTSGVPTAAQQVNDFVVTSSGSAGNGATAPDNSAALELRSSNKGFLPSKVSLQSITDGTTIPNPTNGLIVYNTNTLITNGNGAELYFNSGTAAAPNWAAVSYSNTSSGSTTSKIVYQGATGIIANSVKLGDFEFAINSANVPQFRMNAAPSSTITIDWKLLEAYSPAAQDFHTNTTTFTTVNYNTYQSLGFSTTDAITNAGEVNIMYITIRGAANPSAYRITFFEQSSSSPYTWVI